MNQNDVVAFNVLQIAFLPELLSKTYKTSPPKLNCTSNLKENCITYQYI